MTSISALHGPTDNRASPLRDSGKPCQIEATSGQSELLQKGWRILLFVFQPVR
jgi:hypothetical protein